MRWLVVRGLVGSCLLVVAGIVYSRVPVGAWMLDAPVVAGIRGTPDHVPLGMAIAAVGLILLTSAWWSLVRRVGGDPAGVGRVCLTTAVWVLPLFLAPPLFSNDGWSYVATGYLAGHHLSPYVVTPSVLPLRLRSGVSPVWWHTTSPYGPIPLVWGGWFSHGTADPWLLLLAHRLLALLGLVLLGVAVPRLARRAGHDPARATAIAIASPFVLAQGIGGLHNDMLVAGLGAMALCLTRRGWWWGAGVAGLAAAVKAPGLLIVVGVVLLSLVPGASLASRLRRTVQAAGVAVGTLLVVSLGSGLGFGWVSGLMVTARAPARLAPSTLVGRWIARLLRSSGHVGHVLASRLDPVTAAKDVGLVGLVLVMAWMMLRWKVPDERRAITGAAVAMLVVVLLSPALHYWYFLWCLPLLACIPLRTSARGAYLALLTVLGLASVADASMHVAWLSQTSLVALVATPLVAPVLAVWTRRRSVVSA